MANGSGSTTQNDTWTDEVPALPTQIALYSILLVWSLLGNILVIAVVLTSERLKTSFNYFVVNMAVSDLLVPLVNLPTIIYKFYYPFWPIGGGIGEALCKLYMIVLNISPVVSCYSLVIIAIERLVLVVYPMLKNTLFSNKKIFILIAMTWIVAFIFLCPYFFLFGLKDQEGKLLCYILDGANLGPHVIFSFFSVFSVPLVAIIVIYTIMLYNLLKASRNVAKIINNEQMIARQRRNKKIFYMSIFIIVAFVILWGPAFIFVFLAAVDKTTTLKIDQKKISIIWFVFYFLGYANAAVNPCLYFIFLGSFREGARRMFRKKSESSDEDAHLEMTRLRSTTLPARKDDRSLVESDSLIKDKSVQISEDGR